MLHSFDLSLVCPLKGKLEDFHRMALLYPRIASKRSFAGTVGNVGNVLVG